MHLCVKLHMQNSMNPDGWGVVCASVYLCALTKPKMCTPLVYPEALALAALGDDMPAWAQHPG